MTSDTIGRYDRRADQGPLRPAGPAGRFDTTASALRANWRGLRSAPPTRSATAIAAATGHSASGLSGVVAGAASRPRLPVRHLTHAPRPRQWSVGAAGRWPGLRAGAG